MARKGNSRVIKEAEGFPHHQMQAPPREVMLPPVVNFRGFQFRLVDERQTEEGTEVRLDLFHPLLPVIFVFPFDRLVFADFVRQAQGILVRDEEAGEGA